MSELNEKASVLSVWKNNKAQEGRCINLDWVEVYCEESTENFPHDAAFFRSQLWQVEERDYGTRQYKEMFKLLDNDGQTFVEIRRNPVSGEESHGRNVGIFNPQSCHIRLSNRYCYHNDAINLLSEFLIRYGYTVNRIFRLDLALDFEKFDKGDNPHDFLRRYMAGKYTKVNQTNLTGHAKDRWEFRDWNSCSWGSPKSMISTKLYDKTLELKEVKDKPYIRYAWFRSGLVDDWVELTKKAPDGTTYTPNIWRVEFSIRSSARGYFVIDNENGKKTKRMIKEHTLATYATKENQLHAFANLAAHYFHFKKYQRDQRKDRCEDKILFLFNLNHVPYKLDVLMNETRTPKALDVLIRKLSEFRLIHADTEAIKHVDCLLEYIKTRQIKYGMTDFYDRTELQILLEILEERKRKDHDQHFDLPPALLKTLGYEGF